MSQDNQIAISETKSTDLQQETFIKKIKSIKLLQNEYRELSEKIPAAATSYQLVINKYATEIKELEIKRLKAFDIYFDHVKLNKTQLKDIHEYMVNHICDYLMEDESDVELQEIFKKYAKMSFEDFLKNEKEEMNKHSGQLFKDMFNIKSDLNFDPNDDIQDVSQKILEALENEKLNPTAPPAPERKKTKAQLQKELKQKEEEELKNKSLRTIYIDLMKAFHPDTETDVDLKLEKEEISKRITEAYNTNDLFTLLSIEIDYFEHNRARDLAQNKMKAYLTMLTNQKKQLENDIWRLKNEHYFVYKGMCMKNAKPAIFLAQIERNQLDAVENIKNQLMDLSNFGDPQLKKILLLYVSESLAKRRNDAMESLFQMFDLG
jgi:hypothetical protein